MFQGKDLGQRDVHGESYNRYSKRICDQIGQQRDVWGSRRAKPVTNKTTSVYLCHIRVENTSLNQKTLKQIHRVCGLPCWYVPNHMDLVFL